MNEQMFKDRTKQFALAIIRFLEDLRKDRTTDVIARQLLRSATSIGANYRAACRGRSVADVVAKLGVVEEEADESCYWIELLVESDLASSGKLQALLPEANEITAMTVASLKTLKQRYR